MLEKLGEGIDGVVYRCQKKSNEEEFAVKTFTFEDEHLQGLKTNFFIMKGLSHPNIVNYEALYIDANIRKGWLIMELVKMPSLSKCSPKE